MQNSRYCCGYRLKKTQIGHEQRFAFGILAIVCLGRNTLACLKLQGTSSVSQCKRMLVQTHEKGLHAGMMLELSLCTLAYSAWASNHFDSVDKITLVSRV